MRRAVFALALVGCGDLLGADFDRNARVETPAPSPSPSSPGDEPTGPSAPPADKKSKNLNGSKPETSPGPEHEKDRDGRTAWQLDVLDVSGVAAVAASSAGHVYAATRQGTSGQLFHHTDAGWAQVGLALPNRLLTDLTVMPEGDVFGATTALQADGHLPLLRGNARDWTLLRIGAVGSVDPSAYSVWASGPNDVYALVNKEVRHYGGATWATEKLDPFSPIGTHLWGADADNVYVLSQDGSVRKRTPAGAWIIIGTTPTNFTAAAMGGASANDFMVVGKDGRALHFVQDVGTEIATGTTETLTGVWGSPKSGTWIVGAKGAVLRFDGTSIKPVTIDEAPATAAYEGVGGNDEGALFVVGRATETKKGLILSRSTP